MNLRSASISSPARVLLIDKHAMVRAGLRLLMETQSTMTVESEWSSPQEAIGAASQQPESIPDIIVIDLDHGGDERLICLPELLATFKGTRIIGLIDVYDKEIYSRAVRFGIMGLVLKEKPGDVLLKAIERVHAGEIWIDRTVIASVITEMTRHSNGEEQDSEEYKINSLTAREREVVTLVGEGLKNRDIAARLFISETTVRHHLTSIFDKLGVSDRFELAIYAYRHGLARVPV